MSKPRVVICEPWSTGHRAGYLVACVQAVRESGHEVLVVTTEAALRQPFLTAELRACDTDVVVRDLPERPGLPGGAGDQLRTWRWLRGAARAIRTGHPLPDVFVVPYADYATYAIALLGSPFGSSPWGGIVMRPSFHYAQSGVIAPEPKWSWVRRAAFRRVVENKFLTRLLTIDEPLAEFMLAWSKDCRIRYVPDPVIDLGTALSPSLDLPDGRPRVLVFGSISPRKGVSELLSGLPEEASVIAAGVQDSAIRRIISSDEGRELVESRRLRVVDRFVDPHEVTALMEAADVVWVGYRGHYGMSGVLPLAMFRRKPVVGCREGLIGWHIGKSGLGVAVDLDDPIAVARAIRQAAGMATSESFLAAADRFAERHARMYFDAAVQDLVTVSPRGVDRSIESRHVHVS